MQIWLIILLAVIGGGVLFYLFTWFLIPLIVYRVLLVRTKPDKWTRKCTMEEDPEQLEMYRQAEEWIAQNEDKMTPVHIKNDGFNLYGEYVNFGFDKAVMIIPGRTEACRYSYYYAEPYKRAGYNVLVIDNRCHGLSEGKYNTLGLKEYSDIIAWSKMLHDEYGNKTVVLHGVCIGSATALYALISPQRLDYMVGMVAEGMYTNFRETTKNHMQEKKQMIYPYLDIIMLYFRIATKQNAIKYGPIKVIKNLKTPILFIYSKQDNYSRPDKAQLLYDACGSPDKRIAWFEKGRHSRVRINDQEGYDKSVLDFLETNFSK